MLTPLEALREYVRHPSISTDPTATAGMLGARDFVAGLLQEIGCQTEIVSTPKHPIVLAHREGPAEWPHVLIYGHYDVQPADPLDQWETPAFEPHERNGRLYARGAADNKGPFLAHLFGAARLLEKHPTAPVRLTFLVEGEEEIGSPSFAGFLDAYRERLRADMVMLSDTSSRSPEEVTITCGLRGVVCLEIRLKGPKADLHSGLFGGSLRNPVQALVELVSSLHDAEGRVTVPGFYDDVVTPADWERAELAKLGLSDEDYAKSLGVPGLRPYPGMTPFESVRFMPTLEFNGIGGGYQGEGSKTIIPSQAMAKVSCRLVPHQEPAKIRALLMQTLEERCPPEVELEIIDQHSGSPYGVVPPGRPNTPADQSPVLAKAFEAMHTAVEEVFGHPPLYLREGGSVPLIADLQRVLGLDSLMPGLFTPEDNLHSPNESIHLGMYERGIEVSYRTLKAIAGV